MTRRPPTNGLRIIHQIPGRVRLHGARLRDPNLDIDYLRALLEAMPGVHSVRINQAAGSVVIRHDNATHCVDDFMLALSRLPKDAYLPNTEADTGPDLLEVAAHAGAAALTPFLPMPIQAAMSWFLAAPSLVKGAETLLARGLKIEVLDGTVKLMALLRQDYFTTNTVGALLVLGEYVERSAERKTNDLLKNLLQPQVETVKVERDGVERIIPFDQALIGDAVLVGPGELIPVDGVVAEGEASVNTSSVTGESAPVHAKPGDKVISGSVVEDGKIKITAESVGAETSMARISGFLEKSLRTKSTHQKRTEELADKLVPLTFGAGLGLYALTGDLRRAASVLTVDYSCAIKLSYPVAVRSAMYAAGREGVLIKGAASLERLASVDAFVFDKTGTLTRGELQVTDVVSLSEFGENEILALAAGAEAHYGHPVAAAVVSRARALGLKFPDMSNVDFIVAHGVSAYVDGARVLVGSRHFIHDDEAVDCSRADTAASRLRDQGKSLLYVAKDGELAGLIAMRDDLRLEAAESLQALKNMGVVKLVVLTGDHERTAQAVCSQLPMLDEVHAELKPEDKAAVVEKLKAEGRRIAFVGDGVNDAPSLLAADVGVCMPSGADLARDAAQVVLIKDDIRGLPLALGVAQRTIQTLQRCVWSSVGVNSAVMALAGAGLLPTALSAAAHNGATLGILAYAGLRGVNTPTVEDIRPPRSLPC
ncbi:MAG: heavy metal translocating P-type ATPase [Desulfovibrionaceae bacterium]